MSNIEHIRSYLTSLGYNSAVTCGILANIYKESAYNPKNLQQTGEKKLGMTDSQYTEKVDSKEYDMNTFAHDGFGYGLVQWTYWSRKEALYKKTISKGKSIGDMDAQLAFMTSEMQGYPKLMKAINEAENSEEGAYNVAYVMCTIYEAPADKEKRGEERGKYAKEMFREMEQPHKSYLIVDISENVDEGNRIHTALKAIGYDCHIE